MLPSILPNSQQISLKGTANGDIAICSSSTMIDKFLNPRQQSPAYCLLPTAYRPLLATFCPHRALMRNSDQSLIEAARQARERAQALYSNFKVGAALLGGEGKVYTGCNIESSSYGLTLCAERVALFKALSEGEQEFVRMVVVADTDALTPPCGACRQVLWDFCGDVEIIMTNLKGDSKRTRLSALFPDPFGKWLL